MARNRTHGGSGQGPGSHHGHGRGNGEGHGHGHGNGEGRGHGRGNGEGRGHGHGTGEGRGRGRRRGRRRDDEGQFVETVEEGDVLSVFDAVDGPVVTTTDVSDVLGITTEGARQKLNALVRAEDLQRRKTGRTVVYWETEGLEE